MNLDFLRKKKSNLRCEQPFSCDHPLSWETVYIRRTNETILGRSSLDDMFNVIALRQTEQNKNLFCMYKRDDGFVQNFFVPALVQSLRRGDSIIVCTCDDSLGQQAQKLCLDNNRSYIEPKDIMNSHAGTRVLTGNCMIVLNPNE